MTENGYMTHELSKLLSALRQQLATTRQELHDLEEQHARKAAMFRTGSDVLRHHCAAALGEQRLSGLNGEVQASARAIPTPFGWHITANVRGPSHILAGKNIVISLSCPHQNLEVRQIGCGSAVSQSTKAENAPEADDMIITAMATACLPTNVTLRQQPQQDTVLATVLALVCDNDGSIGTVLPAQPLDVSASAWLRGMASVGGEEATRSTKPWMHSRRLVLRMDGSGVDLLQILRRLVVEMGMTARAAKDGPPCSWSLGEAGQIVCVDSAAPNTQGDLLVELNANDPQVLNVLVLALHRGLQEVGGGGSLLRFSHSYSQNSENSPIELLTSAIDAVVSEIESMRTWISSLKHEYSGPIEHDQGRRELHEKSLSAQQKAVQAMKRTDAALALTLDSSLYNM